jgi:hypothetical protein
MWVSSYLIKSRDPELTYPRRKAYDKSAGERGKVTLVGRAMESARGPRVCAWP